MITPGTNGVHSMEEILADIRRKAAERNASRMAVADRFGAVAAAADDDIIALNDEVQVAEAPDLPSILRSDQDRANTQPSNVRPLRPSSPLRLLEALRGTHAEADVAAASAAPLAEPRPSLAEPRPSPALVEPSASTPAAAPQIDAEASDGRVKRVMVSFLDTRMQRMSASVRVAPAAASAPQAAVAEQPAPEADVAPASTAISAAVLAAGDGAETAAAGWSPDALMGQAFALADALRDDLDQARATMHEPTASDRSPTTMLVPSIDAPAASAQAHAAELLRPMLRQWLADNMPRIVEKALHMELADSLKSGSRNS